MGDDLDESSRRWRKRRRVSIDNDENEDIEEGQLSSDGADVHARARQDGIDNGDTASVLRLVIVHSGTTNNVAGHNYNKKESNKTSPSSLLPESQTLALISETTLIGRDRSYMPLIRLKSLQVSKVHATIFPTSIEMNHHADFEQNGNETAWQNYADPHNLDPGWDADPEHGRFAQEHGAGGSRTSSSRVTTYWSICDNASTYGTLVRSMGESTYTRLSERGVASVPRRLKHGDTIKIASQKFVVHLHPDDLACYECSQRADGSNCIDLLDSQPHSSASASLSSKKSAARHLDNEGLPIARDGLNTMDNTPESVRNYYARTKEEKWQDAKHDLRNLRATLLSASASPSASSGAPNARKSAKSKDSGSSSAEAIRNVHDYSGPVQNSGAGSLNNDCALLSGKQGKQPVSTKSLDTDSEGQPGPTTIDDDSQRIVEGPRYIDRAALRRSLFPSKGSDAHPPARSRHGDGNVEPASQHSSRANSPATASTSLNRTAEPNYGSGASLYARMLSANAVANSSQDSLELGAASDKEQESAASSKPTTSNGMTSASMVAPYASRDRNSGRIVGDMCSRTPVPTLGRVIDVRTMPARGAGIGSAAMITGVENIIANTREAPRITGSSVAAAEPGRGRRMPAPGVGGRRSRAGRVDSL